MEPSDILSFRPSLERIRLTIPYFHAYRGVYLGKKMVAPHYHGELEVLFPEGLAGVTWVSGKRHVFERRSVHVIPPGAVHAFRIWPQGDGSIFVLQMNINRCLQLLKGHPGFDAEILKRRLNRLPVSMGALREPLLQSTLSLSPFRQGPAPSTESALLDLENVARILRLLLEGGAAAPAPAASDDRLRRILDALEKDLGKPFDLGELSRKVSLSRFHLCRLFKQATGMTLTDHLAHARALRAGRLMAEEGMNVTQAAYECGFESVSYFIKVFRKVMGKTPKQWALSGEKESPQ